MSKEKPQTGSGRKGKTLKPKPKKTEIAQRNESGAILWKATSKLWGWRSGKKG